MTTPTSVREGQGGRMGRRESFDRSMWTTRDEHSSSSISLSLLISITGGGDCIEGLSFGQTKHETINLVPYC